MKMIFNAERFREDTSTRGLLPKEHIDELDGLEVIFNNDSQYGSVPHYRVNNEDLYIYPVLRTWCISQLSLF